MRKSSPGFTLVELMVTIAAAAIVMAAALGFMLLGIRMEAHSGEMASQQQTARIVLTMAEKMAVSGDFKKVQHIGGDDEGSSWVIYGDNERYLLQYLSADGSLRMGNSVLMRDLKSAGATFDEDNPKLFTLTIETQQEKYSTTVYCRNGEISADEITGENLLGTAEGTLSGDNQTNEWRLAFLTAMCEQYGSKGEILGHTKTDDEPWEYFSEWYIHQQGAGYEDTDWNKDTPWCACFISWAAAQNSALTSDGLTQTEYYFANVDSGMAGFKDSEKPGTWLERGSTPTPGDIVFFSWDGDDNPEHVGAVLHIDGSNIYTIEGNSGGKVAVNRYALDSDDIIGYGVITWPEYPGTPNQ